jgi:hypothetical protein
MKTLSSFATVFQRTSIATALALLASFAAYAQTPAIDVKIIGVSYLEAPPGRDKNLAAFGTFSSMEKVEVHAVASGKNILFAESVSSFDKGNITANAIAANGSSIALGSADIGSFEKISADRKVRSLNVSISRLPDQAIKGIVFEGQTPVYIFKQLKTAEKKMEAKAPSSLTIDKVIVNISKLEGKTLVIKGTTDLAQIASLSLKGTDGKINTAKRNSYGRAGSEMTHEWEFSSPISSGTLIAELYDGIQEVKLPIRLVVGKPF